MSIYTLTLSPALDKSSTVERVVADHKLRCAEPKFEPGGGGVNVSRAIRKIGGDSVAIYTQGGPTGALVSELLEKEGVKQMPIPVKSWTRENFVVVETSTNRQFRFGMPAPALTSAELEFCLDKIRTLDQEMTYLVVSGSTPSEVPSEFFTELFRIARKKKARIILDSSGESLKKALKEGVYMLKPNHNELSELVGRELHTIDDQEKAAMEIVERGQVEIMVVSLGAFGAFLASKAGVIHSQAPSVKRQSTVGAGDSMVAGVVWAMSNQLPVEQVLRYGIACGTAATMNMGTELCRKEDVDQLYKWLTDHAH